MIAGCAEGAAERAVRAAVGDDQARLQRLAERGDYVCGEVGQSRPTHDRAYIRFVYDERDGRALVDPGHVGVGPAMPFADPACRLPEAYRTVAERMSCAAAPELEAGAERQLAFEQLWDRACAEPGRS